MPSLSQFALAIVQALLLLAAAPLVSGMSRVIRAKMHSRHGPVLLQDYRDIVKLMKRQDVIPPAAGTVFKVMPMVMMATMLVIAMGLPVLTRFCPISALGDLITVIYLLALARFFFSLAGVDSGSAFAGLGGSRELMMGVLVEPIMLLPLIVAALLAGSTDLGAIGTALAGGHIPSLAAAMMAALAFGFAIYFELGKLPYDMAEAEQELQEGPPTEYSGPSLALLNWSTALKRMVLVAWFIGVFLPFGSSPGLSPGGLLLGLAAFSIKTILIFLVVGIVENSVARVRYRLTPLHSWLAVGIASLAFVFYLVGV